MKNKKEYVLSDTADVFLTNLETGESEFQVQVSSLDIQVTKNKYSTPINYPNGFYSYGNGINIGDNKINEWIKACIQYLETSDDVSYSISSGNTKVTVEKGHHLDGIKYYIDVSKSRQELIVYEQGADEHC